MAGNYLKRTYAETLSSTPTALESDFGGGTMTLRVTPADCSTEVTVKDENKQEVFSGSAQEFAAYRFTTPAATPPSLDGQQRRGLPERTDSFGPPDL